MCRMTISKMWQWNLDPWHIWSLDWYWICNDAMLDWCCYRNYKWIIQVVDNRKQNVKAWLWHVILKVGTEVSREPDHINHNHDMWNGHFNRTLHNFNWKLISFYCLKMILYLVDNSIINASTNEVVTYCFWFDLINAIASPVLGYDCMSLTNLKHLLKH